MDSTKLSFDLYTKAVAFIHPHTWHNKNKIEHILNPPFFLLFLASHSHLNSSVE